MPGATQNRKRLDRSDPRDDRRDLTQELEPFAAQRRFDIDEASEVAAGIGDVGDEAAADGIGDNGQDDRDGARLPLQRSGRRRGHPFRPIIVNPRLHVYRLAAETAPLRPLKDLGRWHDCSSVIRA